MPNVTLSLCGITKSYPGVLALDNFSLNFNEGEVHALLGENGAGKSTLIKVIAGAIVPDSGDILFGNGKKYSSLTPIEAKNNGIEVIYQEFNLIDSLSAAENICLGNRFGKFVDQSAMEKKASEIFKMFNIQIDPTAIVETLTSAQQQIVEISKAVSKNAKILIMDEPSAPLTVAEVAYMFDIVKQLKANGVTVIYISHRMEEIFAISDRVTVMRDGCFVQTLNTSETSRPELIRLMVGRELKESYPKRNSLPGEVALEARGLTGGIDTDISFNVRKGEILGISGLVGSGRTELVRMVFGADKMDEGSVYIHGKEVKIKSPADAIHHGIGLIPEDRKRLGCFLEMGIQWNISFASIKTICKYFVVDLRKEKENAEKYKELLKIKTHSLNQLVKNLSGGNQQKVVLAKTLCANSEILIFDEPTRGIDVGAKQEIYMLMNDLAAQGMAIIMISSDMEEILGMSDRIIILSEGRLSGELEKKDFDREKVLDMASVSSLL